MNEQELISKLRRVEALFARAGTEGERVAAAEAKGRLRARLRAFEPPEPLVEFRYCLGNTWSRRLFVSLLRRHGLRPYRYRRQRRTTVMVRVTRSFNDRVLCPEYKKLNSILLPYLDAVAARVIGQVIHADASPADVGDAPPLLASA